MDNLNSEIDLVLSESFSKFLVEQPESDEETPPPRRRRRRSRRASPEGEPTESPPRRRRRRTRASPEGEPTESPPRRRRRRTRATDEQQRAFSEATNDPEAQKIAKAAGLAGEFFGGLPSDDLLYKILGAVLSDPTYDAIVKWFPAVPRKSDLASVYWLIKKWKAIPASVKTAAALFPPARPFVTGLEGASTALEGELEQILRNTNVDLNNIEAPPLFKWLGLSPEKIEQRASRREATPEEKEEVKAMLSKAAQILTIRALNSKEPINLIDNYGRVLRKYFISYRGPRKVNEGILEEAETTGAPSTATPSTPRAATPVEPAIAKAARSDSEDLINALTDEIAVLPEFAEKSLEQLQNKYSDLISDHRAKMSNDENYKKRFNGLLILMLRAAGIARGDEPETRPLQESKIVDMVIDLEKLKSDQLNEGLLSMFGAWIQYFLNGLFGGWSPPVKVKGSQRDVESFARALAGEKRYIESVRQYGLDHPATYRNRAKLNNAVSGFERDTGIKWPFE